MFKFLKKIFSHRPSSKTDYSLTHPHQLEVEGLAESFPHLVQAGNAASLKNPHDLKKASKKKS